MLKTLQLIKLAPAIQGYIPVTLQGARGKDGTDGKDGISLPAHHGIDGKDGQDGLQGEQGHTGADGVDGKQGKPGAARKGHTFEDVKNFKWGPSMQWGTYTFKDGTELVINSVAPTGEADDPMWLMGGDSAGGVTVKDIRAGDDSIEIEVNRGIYTIKANSTSEEFMTEEQSEQLASIDEHLELLVSQQQEQLSKLQLDVAKLEMHASIINNNEKLTESDVDPDNKIR